MTRIVDVTAGKGPHDGVRHDERPQRPQRASPPRPEPAGPEAVFS